MLKENVAILTDNSYQQCAVISDQQPYVVVDLGLEAIVSSIVIWSNYVNVTQLQGFSVVAMNDWRTCYSNSFFSSRNVNCGKLTVSSIKGNAVLNSTSACVGRFIALVNPTSVKQIITVCEMEINGKQQNLQDIPIFQNPYERQCGVNNNPYLALDLALGKYSNSSLLGGSEEENSRSFATDGLEQFNHHCFVTAGTKNYFILDLEREVNISFIRIQNTYWDSPDLALYRPGISNVWQPCNTNVLSPFNSCKGTIVQGSPNDIWELKTDGTCIGRYFILQTINSDTYQWLKICEIEVYGALTNNNILSLDNTFENNCNLMPTDKNVAFRATSYSLFDKNLPMITDGTLNQEDVYNACFFSYYQEYNYVVIDLGAVYQLEGIKVWNSLSGDGADYSIDIGVGLIYRQQYTDKDILNFQIVGSQLSTSNSFTYVKINPSDNIVAQFILIQKEMNYLNSLIVCQLEVSGTLISTMTPTNKRPTISTSSITQLSDNNFPINSILRAGVSYLYYLQNSAPVFSVDPSTEGILWIPSSPLPIAVAGTYGSGKFTVFGKSGYFKSTLNTHFDPIFKKNLYTWLSPSKGLSARVITSGNINTSLQGDIVYFDINSVLSLSQQQKLLNDVKTGKVSVIIEVTYWAELYYGTHRQNYDFLLQALHVDFSGNWLEDSNQKITVSTGDFVNLNYINIIQQLNLITESEDYVHSNGMSVIGYISGMNTYMITQDLITAMKAVVDKYQSLVTFISPGTLTPMQKVGDEILIQVYNAIINNQAMAKYNIKAPMVDIFPGDIPISTSYQTVTRTLNIVSQNLDEIHSTGLYLPAGSSLAYSTKSIQGQWMISIGCHTDELFYEPDNVFYHWIRFPVVHSKYFPIRTNNGTLYSPFGGVVWIQNIDVPGSIKIIITGAVESPFFNIRDPNADNVWTERINAPGLWTEIVGQNVILSAPSNELRSFTATDIRNIITFWDEVVSLQYILSGMDASFNTRERIVIDTQIAYGYGHSGYPIMTVYSWFPNLFKIDVITQPNCWGVLHEFGHRRQQNYFTFTGVEEVTVNIFADYILSSKFNVTLFGGSHEKYSSDTMQTIITYMENGANFNDWLHDAVLAYMIYGQLGYHFGFGLYQKVFTNYTIQIPSLSNDQEIIDLWITLMSDYSGYSLLPLFDFWGFTISDSIRTNFMNKRCFLPNDPISNLVPDRYNLVLSQYNNACDSTPSQTWDVVLPDVIVVQRENDITIT